MQTMNGDTGYVQEIALLLVFLGCTTAVLTSLCFVVIFKYYQNLGGVERGRGNWLSEVCFPVEVG